VLALADKGWRQALVDDLHLRRGLNVAGGRITHKAVAKDLEQLTAKEAGLKADLDSTKKQLEELKASYEKAQTRVKELGLSEATGLLLRRERDNLPDVREVRRKAQEREAEINAATEKQLNYEDQRLKLADVDAELDKIVEELDPNLSESMLAWIKNEARGILENKRELLQKLNAGYLRYQKSLGDLEADQQQLVRMSNEYATFIDENVLWIRSMQPVGLDNIKHVPDGFGWLFNPNRWGTFASDLMRAMGRRPVFWLLAAVFTIGLILARPWLRRRLRQVGEGTNKPDTDSIMLTLRALLITIAIALGLPLLMMFVGWRLSGMIDADDFSRAVGSGLIDAGIMLFTLSAFFQVFTPNGLAETHFRWRKPVRNDVRRHMVWLIPLQVSMEFIVGSSDTYASLTLGSDEWVRGSLGLLAFLAAMITLAVFVAIVLRNEGGVMTSIRTNGKDGWLIRLRFAWYWLAVGIPLALGLLACMGYFYTALQLDDRLQQTMWLVMGLIVLNGLILRGYYVELRQLALAEARRKAEELKKQQQEGAAKELTGGESKPDESSQQPKIEEPKEVDIQAIGEQTTALLRTLLAVIALVGLWAIWAEVLPALNLFDNVELWSQTVQIAEGKTEIVPITLTDLLAAILIFGVTMAASKNLPGALEITILNRLPFDAGARYAWSTICQYSIVFAGIALSLSTLGLDMSKLGWLFAALSVGIGFGLQEIVANFICGLILLFERPIRVGDIVEVGGQTGIVSRIRIRATTIVNWDRKEYIVPNKQFITATMLNWTLSNTVNRIVIPIGVAYGSDTDKTREILKRICADHPLIMDDPTTLVTFEGFGDNALNFVVRTYLPDFANRIETIHQLHTTIYKELNEAGITIAFPQRDIHLDTSNPLEIRVIQGETPDGKGD